MKGSLSRRRVEAPIVQRNSKDQVSTSRRFLIQSSVAIRTKIGLTLVLMKIELTHEIEAYIQEQIRSGAFASPSEFVEEAARRQMQEEAWFEEKVLAGLRGEVTPLTREDLQSVRDIVKKARDGKHS